MFGSKILSVTMAAAVILGGACAAFAANNDGESNDRDEISATVNAKTSLTQAIAAAEQETGGKAIDAGVENQDGAMAYEVEVIKDNTVHKVLVALDTGKVIKVMPADTEHGEDGEHESD